MAEDIFGMRPVYDDGAHGATPHLSHSCQKLLQLSWL